VPIQGAGRTDRELAELDVPALLRAGLADRAGLAGRARLAGGGGPAGGGGLAGSAGLAGGHGPAGVLFGDGAIAAAIAADRLGVQPRSLTFLAEVVRRGGIGYASALAEPLPGADRTALARSWLAAVDPPSPERDAAEPERDAPSPERDAAECDRSDEFARWLDAVAVILGLRQHSAPPAGAAPPVT
jgi:hypothetical protein